MEHPQSTKRFPSFLVCIFSPYPVRRALHHTAARQFLLTEPPGGGMLRYGLVNLIRSTAAVLGRLRLKGDGLNKKSPMPQLLQRVAHGETKE